MTSSPTPTSTHDRFLDGIPAGVLLASEIGLLLVILVVAWNAWSHWPLVPFADPDTWGYLAPSLTLFSGDGFRQHDGRDWLYPAMLAVFLKTTWSFSGIVIWQKWFALAAGIAMAIAWRAWTSMLPFGRGLRWIFTLAGAWPIYVQLVNQQNIFFTWSIRPESVLPLFVYAQLACLLGYCKYRWQTPRPHLALLTGVFAIFFAYACFLLKPSWYLATAVTVAPVFLGLFGRALPLETRLTTPILGIVITGLLLVLPPRLFLIPDGAARTLLPYALLCVHAEFVERSLEAKLPKLADSDPQKAAMLTFLGVLHSEVDKSKHTRNPFPKLGVNVDYLMASKTLSAAVNDYSGNTREKFVSFCFAAFFDAVASDPGGYFKKVRDQMAFFAFPDGKDFFHDTFGLKRPYQDSAACWFEQGDALLRSDVRDLYGKYRQAIDEQLASPGSMEKYPRLRVVREILGRAAFPLEIVFFLVLGVTVLWSPLHHLRTVGCGALVLFSAPFSSALGVSLVHTLDVYRYRATYCGSFLFALAAMTLFIAIVLICTSIHLTTKRSRSEPALS